LLSSFFLINCFFVDLPSAGTNAQVVEGVPPLAAKVGQEFLDKLNDRGRKNKASASNTGPSEEPPAKRSKKDGGGKPYTTKRYRSQMPVATG
jgi:hypothetical protein